MSLKHISRLIIGLLALSGVSSCSDDFLAVVPPTFFPPEQFLATSGNLKETLNSSFAALTYEDFYGGKLQLMNELPADNMNVATITNGDWKAGYDRSVGVFNAITSEVLGAGYRAINRANFALENIAQFDDLDAAEKLRLAGEARFVRGIAHFELVRLFAQPYGFTGTINGVSYTNNGHPGIPLRVTYATARQNRATVAEVYASIIEDLKFAEANLSDDPGYGGLGHPTKMSARGFLAKVYFQMNDFTNAYAYADQVVSSGTFAMDSVMARFNPAWSSENVFALYSNDANNDNAAKFLRDQFAYNPPNNIMGWSNGLYSLVSNNGDARGQKWFKKDNFIFSTKFVVGGNAHNPICHLTELKLIRAEAAAELGNLAVGIQDINDIRNRAGIGTIADETTKSVLIEEARTQRRIEMYAEGNRLQDLKRIGALNASRGDNTFTIRTSAWDCAGLVYQFPASELSGNLDLEPNPTGGCN